MTDREVAEAAAAAAGAAALARFGGALDVAYKSSGGGPVTDADRAAEAAARVVLRAERPGDGVLREEGGATGGAGGRRWVVDALDGTANFLHGIPHWCAAVALQGPDGTVLASAVQDEARAERFSAARGEAAGRPGIARRSAPAPRLDRALVATFLRPDKVGPDRAGPLSAALWTATVACARRARAASSSRGCPPGAWTCGCSRTPTRGTGSPAPSWWRRPGARRPSSAPGRPGTWPGRRRSSTRWRRC